MRNTCQFQCSCGLRISSTEAVFRLEQFLESLLSRSVSVEDSSWRRLIKFWTYQLTFIDRGEGKGNELNLSPSPFLYSGIFLETLWETLVIMTDNHQSFTWNALRMQQLGQLYKPSGPSYNFRSCLRFRYVSWSACWLSTHGPTFGTVLSRTESV